MNRLTKLKIRLMLCIVVVLFTFLGFVVIVQSNNFDLFWVGVSIFNIIGYALLAIIIKRKIKEEKWWQQVKGDNQ